MKLKMNKKGFTLVEIIIVLVILAILAAVAIPSMIGFVNKAKGQQYVAEARAALVAAQTLATEKYATNSADKAVTEKEIVELIGDSEITEATCKIDVDINDTGKVTKLEYTKGGKLVTISPPEAAVITDSNAAVN